MIAVVPLVVIEPLSLRSAAIRSTASRPGRESTFGRGVSVQARPGDAVRDLCDDANAPVPFSCRSGRCGTCYVEVIEGGDQLAPVGEDERLVLDTLRAEEANDPRPRHRLACQARVDDDAVDAAGSIIRLRVAPLRQSGR